MKCVRKRLGDLGSKNEKFFSSLLLLHRANGFTIRIRDGNLLGARRRLGVTTVSAFMSLNGTVAAFPLMETAVAL